MEKKKKKVPQCPWLLYYGVADYIKAEVWFLLCWSKCKFKQWQVCSVWWGPRNMFAQRTHSLSHFRARRARHISKSNPTVRWSPGWCDHPAWWILKVSVKACVSKAQLSINLNPSPHLNWATSLFLLLLWKQSPVLAIFLLGPLNILCKHTKWKQKVSNDVCAMMCVCCLTW